MLLFRKSFFFFFFTVHKDRKSPSYEIWKGQDMSLTETCFYSRLYCMKCIFDPYILWPFYKIWLPYRLQHFHGYWASDLVFEICTWKHHSFAAGLWGPKLHYYDLASKLDMVLGSTYMCSSSQILLNMCICIIWLPLAILALSFCATA